MDALHDHMAYTEAEAGLLWRGRRTRIFPRSHQFSSIFWGKEHELMARSKEIHNISRRFIDHYIKCTGLSEKEVRKYLLPPEDVWLSAQEAVKYGIADEIVEFY